SLPGRPRVSSPGRHARLAREVRRPDGQAEIAEDLFLWISRMNENRVETLHPMTEISAQGPILHNEPKRVVWRGEFPQLFIREPNMFQDDTRPRLRDGSLQS